MRVCDEEGPVKKFMTNIKYEAYKKWISLKTAAALSPERKNILMGVMAGDIKPTYELKDELPEWQRVVDILTETDEILAKAAERFFSQDAYKKMEARNLYPGGEFAENWKTTTVELSKDKGVIWVNGMKECPWYYMFGMYIGAWSELHFMPRQEDEDLSLQYAYALLEAANKVYMQNQFDFSEEANMPLHQADFLMNLNRLYEDVTIKLNPLDKAEDVYPLSYNYTLSPDDHDHEDHDNKYKPMMNPPVATRHMWNDGSKKFYEGHRGFDEPLKVFYMAGHATPFFDVLEMFKRLFSKIQIDAHGIVVPKYESFPGMTDFANQDEELREKFKPFMERDSTAFQVLALHSDPELADWMDDWYDRKYPDGHDVILCGHPLFWCSLFRRQRPKLMLTVVDQPFTQLLNATMWDPWARDLEEMLKGTGGLNFHAVAYSYFHKLQFEYLFPQMTRKMLYTSQFALSYQNLDCINDEHHFWKGTYGKKDFVMNSVLLARGPQTEYMIKLLKQLVGLTETPLKFHEWGKDVPAEANKCGLKENYYAAILFPYDMFPYKLAELYHLNIPILTHRNLWRWVGRGSHMQTTTLFDVPNWMREHRMGHLHEAFGGSEMEPYSHPPFEFLGGFELNVKSLSFWHQFSEFALRPYIIYFNSLMQAVELTLDELIITKAAELMRLWHDREIGKAEKFWKNFIGQNVLEGQRKGKRHELDILDSYSSDSEVTADLKEGKVGGATAANTSEL